MSATPADSGPGQRLRLLPRPLRSLLSHPRVEPRIAALLRSSVVYKSPAFALRELTGSRAAHVYRIRESGLDALVVHGTADAHSLDQAYYQRAHEPPPAAVAVLQGLGRPLRALDVGANIGIWGLWLHGRFAVEHITALEPDPDNVARHRRQIELNGLGSSWEVIEVAAVTADGPVSFTIGEATNGRVTNAENGSAASVTGRDLFALLDGLDLLKIDIEGGEWPILADPRAVELCVPVVMIEYHADGAPSADAAGDAIGALTRAGYTTAATVESRDGFGVVWGWRSPARSA